MDYTLPIPPEEYELSQWIKLETKVASKVTSGSGYGVADRKDFESRTGLEYLKAMIEGAVPSARIAQTLNFHLLEAKSGYVLYQGTPLDAHLNPPGTIHGGWIATILVQPWAERSTASCLRAKASRPSTSTSSMCER